MQGFRVVRIGGNDCEFVGLRDLGPGLRKVFEEIVDAGSWHKVYFGMDRDE